MHFRGQLSLRGRLIGVTLMDVLRLGLIGPGQSLEGSRVWRTRCIVTINVLWLFLTVPWVGLQYVIVVFADHTHIFFEASIY